MKQDKKAPGRPKKEKSKLLKPRFTVSLDDDTWKSLNEATEHPVAFSREAIIEKLNNDKKS
ncbi:MAG: hypothetical protein CMB99_02900 [Flavobacteriaceae bacterium]|nr:hypothetical protein [Flavobacteriaceae bacterium]|tara:strand:- start:3837 stop:4019 length:183 start_codon:yes stop_codon:yes gene_type:complete